MVKIILLAASAGGKSTLMKYMREHTNLNVMEMDEEIIKINHGTWPNDNNYKDQILVPKIVENILDKDEVIYLASYVPDYLIEKARLNNFKVLLLEVSIDELIRRNKHRMKIERYEDASHWFRSQINTFNKLKEKELVDGVINGNSSTEDIAIEISSYITQ